MLYWNQIKISSGSKTDQLNTQKVLFYSCIHLDSLLLSVSIWNDENSRLIEHRYLPGIFFKFIIFTLLTLSCKISLLFGRHKDDDVIFFLVLHYIDQQEDLTGTIQELKEKVSVIDDRVEELGEATVQIEKITKDQLSIGSISRFRFCSTKFRSTKLIHSLWSMKLTLFLDNYEGEHQINSESSRRS